MSNQIALKERLRKKYLEERRKMSSSLASEKSTAIAKNTANIAEITAKRNVGIYIAVNNEVETKKIINRLVKTKHNIYTPAYCKKERGYCFSKFSGFSELNIGPFGIGQPKKIIKMNPSKIEFVFIPGLAFSKNGVRLGYGKGVYDNLLKNSKALRIGLAFELQIVDELPAEKHDLQMDLVVSEKAIYRPNR